LLLALLSAKIGREQRLIHKKIWVTAIVRQGICLVLFLFTNAKKTPNDMFGVFFCSMFLSARCGGEDTTYYAALAKHACASGEVCFDTETAFFVFCSCSYLQVKKYLQGLNVLNL